jgi:glycosyltransferase involved in cell wall biosynthesis
LTRTQDEPERRRTVSIVFVLQALSSGTLKYARDLTSGLSSEGVRIVAASLDSDYRLEGSSESYFAGLQGRRPASHLVARIVMEVARLPLALSWLVRIVIRERIDALYTQNMDESALLCCLAGLLTRRPVILFVQDITEKELYVYDRGFSRYSIPFLYAVARIRHTIVSRFSPSILVASRFIQNEIRAYSRRPIVVIPHGIATPSPQRPKVRSGGVNLVCIGKVERKKRFDVPIRALTLLRDLDVRLTIVGEGPLRPNCIELARNLGVAERVHLPGFLDDTGLREVLQGANLGVAPSMWEGFGYMTLEMMAYGLPVLASNAGAFPEVVRKGYNGFLFAPGDFENLASRIRGLYADPDLLDILAAGAAETAREFSLAKMKLKTKAAIEEIVSRPRVRNAV